MKKLVRDFRINALAIAAGAITLFSSAAYAAPAIYVNGTAGSPTVHQMTANVYIDKKGATIGSMSVGLPMPYQFVGSARELKITELGNVTQIKALFWGTGYDRRKKDSSRTFKAQISATWTKPKIGAVVESLTLSTLSSAPVELQKSEANLNKDAKISIVVK